jgi:hypothetical protein
MFISLADECLNALLESDFSEMGKEDNYSQLDLRHMPQVRAQVSLFYHPPVLSLQGLQPPNEMTNGVPDGFVVKCIT